MNISAVLLADNLKEAYPLFAHGRIQNAPLLRPLFYNGKNAVERNRVYVADPSCMPPLKQIPGNTLVICAGGHPSLQYKSGECQLLILPQTQPTEVFNAVVGIFEKYETWESEVLNIAETSADITQIVRASFPLFLNDLTFMDANLALIASICYKEDDSGKPFVEDLDPYARIMPADIASGFRQEYSQNMAKHGLYVGDGGCYCVNFFSDDALIGTLSLNPTNHPFRTSDVFVFQALAEKLQPAVQNLYERKRVEKTSLHQKLLSLLSGVPGEELGLPDSGQTQYICICIDPANGIQQFPANYLSGAVSAALYQSPVIPYEGNLTGVLDLADFGNDEAQMIRMVKEALAKFEIDAGVSGRFSSLGKLRYYYRQSCQALLLGRKHPRKDRLYRFGDYALRYMLYHSSGDFPARYICPPKLPELRAESERGRADYWITLRLLLDNQMNMTKTAEDLQIHRNTLIQRIAKIRSILQMDLESPDDRLWLRICMYLFDLESEEREGL